MALWALLPAIAGMASQAAGSQQAAASTVEGARTQAEIEAMNREYQRKIFEEELARNKPRYEAGTQQGLPLLAQYMNSGGIDLDTMPLYRMQRDSGLSALDDEGMDNPFTRERFMSGLNAAENEASYARLGDLLQIALGSSGSAGRGAQNYASDLSHSYLTSGNALTQGAAGAGGIRQSMYSNLTGQAGSIPAFVSQSNYLRQQNQPQLSTYGPYRDNYRMGE